MKLKNIYLLLMSALVMLFSGMASAAAPDYSGITGAIDFSTLLTALGTVAGLMVAPLFTKWGFSLLLAWFRGR